LRKRLTKLFPVFLILLSAVVSTAYSQVIDDDNILNALNTGDTARAIELLNGAIAADPGYHRNYFALGRIYYEREQWQNAKEQFETAYEKRSKDYESLLYFGRTQINLGELDDAEKTMQEGIKKSKDNLSGFENGLGLVYLARGEYQDADKYFRKAIASSEAQEEKTIKDLNTKKFESEEEKQATLEAVRETGMKERAEYHINLGDANFYQGIPALAIIEYDLALQIDTASTEVYFHWAEACIEMKDYTCAIEKLKVVLQKDSTYAPAWMRAGGIYFKAALSTRTRDERKARFIDAIGSYKRYLELSNAQPDSQHVRVFFELAMGYANVSGHEDACQYYQKVLDIPYEPRDIYFQYGKSLWYIQDWAKAREMLRKQKEWVEADPDRAEQTKVSDDEYYQLLGDTYYYDKDNRNFTKASEYYEKSIQLNPNQKRVVYNLAIALHQDRHLVKALSYYQKRLDLEMDDKVLKNAGYCAMSIANQEMGGGADEAVALDDLEGIEGNEDAVDVDTPDPNVNYYEVAADYLQQYLEIKPDDESVIQRIAQIYLYHLSDCARGVEWYERWLQINPNSCEALRSLGYAYFGGVCSPKSYTKALSYFHKAYDCLTKAEGECADPGLTLYIAQAYHLRAVDKKDGAGDDFKQANTWYKKVLKCEPGNTDAKKGADDTSFEF